LTKAEVKREMAKVKKTAFDVTSDYLRALYGHAISLIAEQHSTKYFEILGTKFVLSVPANFKATPDVLRVSHCPFERNFVNQNN